MDRRLVGGILEKNPDWTIIYAVNGKEALVEIEKHIPDLVLTGSLLRPIRPQQPHFPSFAGLYMCDKPYIRTTVYQ